MTKEIQTIEKQRKRWIDAINQASVDGFTDVITSDAVWLPSMNDAINGKKKIREWLEEPFSKFNYDYSVSGIRIRIAGERAVEQARFLTKATTKSGESMPVHEGEYTILWKKTPEDGWLIERYIDYSAEFEQLS